MTILRQHPASQGFATRAARQPSPSALSPRYSMTDQAHNLRQQNRQRQQAVLPTLPALAITGGKGGVGKTSLSVNISILLAKLGIRPLLVDCDLGLANADVLLGINPTNTLFEVIMGGAPLDEAIIETNYKTGFIPAASGREELTHLSHQQFAHLIQQIHQAGSLYDLIMFDTMAGISQEVITFLRCSKLVLNVITPDPTSLTDAYALIKVLHAQDPNKDIQIIVNMAASASEGEAVFKKINTVTTTYLGKKLSYLGHIPRDIQVTESIRSRKPFVLQSSLPSTQALCALTMKLKHLL